MPSRTSAATRSLLAEGEDREDDPVPLPRLDVRPRRLAPRRAALGARGGLRPGGTVSRPAAARDLGPVPLREPRPRCAPLADTLGPVPDLVRLDGLVFHARDEYELAANWKIACENYLECYHCPVAHKGFSAAYDVDPDAYRLEPTGEHVLSQFAQTRDGGEGQGQFHFVWPNLKINVLAGCRTSRSGRRRRPGPSARAASSTFFAGDADAGSVAELPRSTGRSAR